MPALAANQIKIVICLFFFGSTTTVAGDDGVDSSLSFITCAVGSQWEKPFFYFSFAIWMCGLRATRSKCAIFAIIASISFSFFVCVFVFRCHYAIVYSDLSSMCDLCRGKDALLTNFKLLGASNRRPFGIGGDGRRWRWRCGKTHIFRCSICVGGRFYDGFICCWHMAHACKLLSKLIKQKSFGIFMRFAFKCEKKMRKTH